MRLVDRCQSITQTSVQFLHINTYYCTKNWNKNAYRSLLRLSEIISRLKQYKNTLNASSSNNILGYYEILFVFIYWVDNILCCYVLTCLNIYHHLWCIKYISQRIWNGNWNMIWIWKQKHTTKISRNNENIFFLYISVPHLSM